MEAFLGLIGLGVILWFVYALFNPEGAVYWHENPSRMKAFGYLLLGMFVIGSMSPNAGDSESSGSSNTDASEDAATGNSMECVRVSGTYIGLYENKGTGETGKTRIEIDDDCEYDFYIDRKRYGSGTAEYSGGSIAFDGGLTTRYSGGVIKGRTNTVTGEIVFALEETY